MTGSISRYSPQIWDASQAHIWNGDIGTLPQMGASARLVLAANLTRLMAESDNLKTIKQLHAASGVSTGTIDRIRRAQISTGVDQLVALARPFGLEPWQLLEAGVHAVHGAPSQAGLAVGATYDKMSPKQQEIFLKLLEVSFGASEQDRPREFGHSDAMDIELEMPDVDEEKHRGRR